MATNISALNKKIDKTQNQKRSTLAEVFKVQIIICSNDAQNMSKKNIGG